MNARCGLSAERAQASGDHDEAGCHASQIAELERSRGSSSYRERPKKAEAIAQSSDCQRQHSAGDDGKQNEDLEAGPKDGPQKGAENHDHGHGRQFTMAI